jgi:hypothetical protein
MWQNFIIQMNFAVCVLLTTVGDRSDQEALSDLDCIHPSLCCQNVLRFLSVLTAVKKEYREKVQISRHQLPRGDVIAPT